MRTEIGSTLGSLLVGESNLGKGLPKSSESADLSIRQQIAREGSFSHAVPFGSPGLSFDSIF